MPFQIAFGDDEHTLSDGPYARTIRARKWLYFAATVQIANELKLIDWMTLSKKIEFLTFDPSIMSVAIASMSIYLIFQYIVLLTQLSATYVTILHDRTQTRSEQQITELENSYESSVNTLALYRTEQASATSDKPHLAGLRVENSERQVSDFAKKLDVARRRSKVSPVVVASEVIVDLQRTIVPLLVAVTSLAMALT